MREINITGYSDYYTAEGDTFDRIALDFYNEEKLAYLIINANPNDCDVLIFDAGVYLRIPTIDTVDYPDTLPPWRR